MAKRGRPPKETTPAGAQGRLGPGRPDMPPTISMDAVAAGAWDEVCDLLGDVLTPGDVGVLVSYATAYSTIVHARRQLAPTPGPLVHPKSGKPLKGKALLKAQAEQPWVLTATAGTGAAKLHPLVGLINAASRDLARYAAELGLTPYARSRSGQAQAPAEDEFDRWLRENRTEG